MKKIIEKYSHAWVFLYALIYMPWFLYLEKHVTSHYYVIHSPIDDLIPFNEYFVVPYLFWFAFMAIATFYFFFTDKGDFYRLAAFCIPGMTIFLIICTLFPNGQELRPFIFERSNQFTVMVLKIYATDTPTNVLPSIHVFNSLGIAVAVAKSEHLKKKSVWKRRIIQWGTYTVAALIILSTMFLKQHSITDVIAAIVMAAGIYPFVYEWSRSRSEGRCQAPLSKYKKA